MENEKIQLYQEAIRSISAEELQKKKEKIAEPQEYIVATHGPALAKAIKEYPHILDSIGIYRVNCSHLGKEPDLSALAEYLGAVSPFVQILIDLQGPKPRIHEMGPQGDITVSLGEILEVSYASADSEERFCTPGKLKVCFPEIVSVMQSGDSVIFDDGKMTAIVRERQGEKAFIECTEILSGEKTFTLGGRKGICVRNRPLGIQCITDHDRKSIDFAKNILGFDFVDNVMVSYFSELHDIEEFIDIMRNEYSYIGNLGGKFETPMAIVNSDEILAKKELSLAMLGRGDLRVEMDPRSLSNIHDIQTYFFSICQKYTVESICATGFLESMIPVGGVMTEGEKYDMETSVLTGPDHLMLSGETSYGSQAKSSILLEQQFQTETLQLLEQGKVQKKTLSPLSIQELLYIEK